MKQLSNISSQSHNTNMNNNNTSHNTSTFSTNARRLSLEYPLNIGKIGLKSSKQSQILSKDKDQSKSINTQVQLRKKVRKSRANPFSSVKQANTKQKKKEIILSENNIIVNTNDKCQKSQLKPESDFSFKKNKQELVEGYSDSLLILGSIKQERKENSQNFSLISEIAEEKESSKLAIISKHQISGLNQGIMEISQEQLTSSNEQEDFDESQELLSQLGLEYSSIHNFSFSEQDTLQNRSEILPHNLSFSFTSQDWSFFNALSQNALEEMAQNLTQMNTVLLNEYSLDNLEFSPA